MKPKKVKQMGTDPVLRDIANKIRAAMKHKNMSGRELFTKTGISSSTLSEILYARKGTTLDVLRRVLDAMDVKYEFFVITDMGEEKTPTHKKPGVKPKHSDPDKLYYNPPPAKQVINPTPSEPADIWDDDIDIYA